MRRSIPVLLYHSIDTECSAAYRRWVVTPDRFDAQMLWLKEHGYTALSISDLVAATSGRAPLPEKTVAITFDDGLRDFLHFALPILDRHAFTATLYVVSGLVGQTSRWLDSLGEGRRPMLAWDELAEVCRRGIECGAHTMSHPQLDIVPRNVASDQIMGSKLLLEDQLDCEIKSFAYPHGYAGKETRELVRNAGFTSAARVRHALSSDQEDCFSISRIIVTESFDGAAMAAAIEGTMLPVAPPPDRLLSAGWRFARKIENAISAMR